MPEGMTVVAALQPQDIQLIQTQAESDKNDQEPIPVTLIQSELNNEQETDIEASISLPAQYLQSADIEEYLQNTINDIKRGQITENGFIETVSITPDEQGHLIMQEAGGEIENEESVDDPSDKNKKKKYEKKPPKPQKPKPGQVHIAKAVDGTTLFCCPECHMAYQEKELLEQHLVDHKIERRFICAVCGAGFKRKEHLERHKVGHNPERPFVCSVCMKGFKQKENLNLHFYIHSGKKTKICEECGKGFYRKDHLRKHTKAHINRRARELAEQAEEMQELLSKDATTTTETDTSQANLQVDDVPNSQIYIPVQIQVPQHHIQVFTPIEEDGETAVSTLVLLTTSEGLCILPN